MCHMASCVWWGPCLKGANWGGHWLTRAYDCCTTRFSAHPLAHAALDCPTLPRAVVKLLLMAPDDTRKVRSPCCDFSPC